MAVVPRVNNKPRRYRQRRALNCISGVSDRGVFIPSYLLASGADRRGLVSHCSFVEVGEMKGRQGGHGPEGRPGLPDAREDGTVIVHQQRARPWSPGGARWNRCCSIIRSIARCATRPAMPASRTKAIVMATPRAV